MPTILFNEIVFGPIHSRRLGISLGINLLPTDGKLCSFDCIYCECGYNADRKPASKIPTRAEVRAALDEKLHTMQEQPDVITFAGNGEPTIHPEFALIVDDVIELRNRYFPNAKISVLSNSSMIDKEDIFQALNKIDNNILKIDASSDDKLHLIDQPNSSTFNVKDLVRQMKRFDGNVIIQTMFLRGTYNGQSVDNTGEKEVSAWIDILKEVSPRQVMIYTIDRETPAKGLEKVSVEELNSIAEKVKQAGFDVSVSG